MIKKYYIKCTERIKDGLGTYLTAGTVLPKIFTVENICPYLYKLKKTGLIIISEYKEDIPDIPHLSNDFTEDLLEKEKITIIDDDNDDNEIILNDSGILEILETNGVRGVLKIAKKDKTLIPLLIQEEDKRGEERRKSLIKALNKIAI